MRCELTNPTIPNEYFYFIVEYFDLEAPNDQKFKREAVSYKDFKALLAGEDAGKYAILSIDAPDGGGDESAYIAWDFKVNELAYKYGKNNMNECDWEFRKKLYLEELNGKKLK